MQIAYTIAHMRPGAKFDVVEYADGSIEIENWEHEQSKPTKEEIEAHWLENETAIMEANKPQPSELDLLKQKQELMQVAIDDLILGGMM